MLESDPGDLPPSCVVRCTVIAVSYTREPPPSVSLRKERRPNGTYEFSANCVIQALGRIAGREKWQLPPAQGSALIKTWHNRHPKTLARWVREQAKVGTLAEVPEDSAPTWEDVVEDLVERQEFHRMTCPTCAKEYVPADLRMERFHENSPSYERKGRKWLCPQEHLLLTIVEWWIHRTVRAESSWTREE